MRLFSFSSVVKVRYLVHRSNVRPFQMHILALMPHTDPQKNMETKDESQKLEFGSIERE